ncbi:hypothetical protein [Loigolactobacillus zhaoyuanensis]|uniref:Uncharacterized protein n=1 Tax=Loigolactobacillus zhaoyuanensis TaxID=2486017 RepID=A0ABW8UCF8_9LACO|nr:hypothetical protein [Loigolactobacillus zhaoyuanensis]
MRKSKTFNGKHVTATVEFKTKTPTHKETFIIGIIVVVLIVLLWWWFK